MKLTLVAAAIFSLLSQVQPNPVINKTILSYNDNITTPYENTTILQNINTTIQTRNNESSFVDHIVKDSDDEKYSAAALGKIVKVTCLYKAYYLNNLYLFNFTLEQMMSNIGGTLYMQEAARHTQCGLEITYEADKGKYYIYYSDFTDYECAASNPSSIICKGSKNCKRIIRCCKPKYKKACNFFIPQLVNQDNSTESCSVSKSAKCFNLSMIDFPKKITKTTISSKLVVDTTKNSANHLPSVINSIFSYIFYRYAMLLNGDYNK